MPEAKTSYARSQSRSANRVKLFRGADVMTLERRVNDWLLGEDDAIQVVDMQTIVSDLPRPYWSVPAHVIVIAVLYVKRD